MEKIKRSLFIRLAALILVGTGLVFLAVIWINQRMVSPQVLELRGKYYTALVSESAGQINAHFFKAAHEVDRLADQFLHIPLTRTNATELLLTMLDRNSDLFGGAIALASDQDHEAAGFQIIYVWNEDGRRHVIDRSDVEGDYRSDWFYLPQYMKKPVWSDPYFDTDTDVLMVTYSVPVMQNDRLVAVITCDLSLKKINEMVQQINSDELGTSVLMTAFGTLIIHPNYTWVLNETLSSLSEGAESPDERATMQALLRSLSEQKQGSFFFKHEEKNTRTWFYFNAIAATDWNIGFIMDEHLMLAPVRKMNRSMYMIAGVGMILLLIPAFWVSLTITRPLRSLCFATDALASGQFDSTLPTRTHQDEIGRLISGFDSMRIELKNYIENLASTTAAKEKIESELSIACEIQHSILPKLFPPFPKRPGLDLFASLESAREVGGDLYDFTLLDDDHLYFCIGDVSGKGVPASLFMAVGKTLLKSTFQGLRDPALSLTHVNNELAQGNDSCMFITVFCGMLTFSTNEVIYSNAGHNPPVSIRGEAIKFLPPSESPPVGAMENMEFTNNRLQLHDAEQLLLYTDGVTEAMNPSLELFGEERLLAFLSSVASRTAEKRISTIAATVKEFSDGAEQSDDITMLCISNCRQPSNGSTLRSPSAYLVLTNRREEFARMVSWLEELAVKLEWGTPLLMQLNLALEEWVVNLISYAFPDGKLHEVELRVWQLEDAVKVEVIDDGVAFDPTQQAAPNLDTPIEEREIGGLGIHFIKNTMDEFSYARIDECNVVTFVKKLGATEQVDG